MQKDHGINPSELDSNRLRDTTLDPNRIEKLARSMDEHGFKDDWPVVVVGEEKAVVDGRHRIAAAKQLGLEVVTLTMTWEEFDEFEAECVDLDEVGECAISWWNQEDLARADQAADDLAANLYEAEKEVEGLWWKAEQVQKWLDKNYGGHKSNAAEGLGVGRPWLDKALEKGADKKHTLAMMMIGRTIDVRTGSHTETDEPLDFVVCVHKNKLERVTFEHRLDDGSKDITRLQHQVRMFQTLYPDAMLSEAAEEIMEIEAE